ncbi:type VI secretion system contractile sheath domain-containing protein, partial [Cellvibrio sp.]
MEMSEAIKPADQLSHFNDFSSLLHKEFKPKTEEAKTAVQTAVQTLAQQALSLSMTVSNDAYKAIESIIAEIDTRLSEQINTIIHHPDFLKLESAWRGLHYLVNNTETDEMLKIRFLPITKQELHRTLRRHKGVG